MTPVRWGFIGAGFVAGQGVAPAVDATPSAELVAVASRSADRARAVAPRARAYTSYLDLLADDEVEAVYVSLTNDAHLEWTVRALEAGKHVLCEKPLGLDAGQVREIAATAQRTGRTAVEATWNRWHPRTVRAIELLRSGELGRTLHVDAAFAFRGVPADNYRWLPERGGGALYDVGCYAVGAVLWALDRTTVTDVTTTVRRTDGGVDAETVADLRLGETSARVRASIDGDEEQHLVVTAEGGSVELSSPAFTSWHEPSSLLVRDGDGGVVRTEEFAAVDPYALMVDAFSRHVRGDRAAWVLPLEESLAVAEALDAVRTAPAAGS